MNLETELSSLEIAPRFLTALNNLKLTTVNDVMVRLKDNSLQRLPGIGKATVTEVKIALEGAGFDIPENPDSYESRVIHAPTDDEIGDMLIEDFQGNLRFFFGTWHEYDNGIWTPVRSFDRRIWEKLKELKAFGVKPSAYKVTAVEKYLQTYLWVDDTEIDTNEKYINLSNGLFNLESEELEDHRRDLYMTSQLPFRYDPDAIAPTFERFLRDVLVHSDGKPDATLKTVILEALGYSLTANTDHRVSFWLVGGSGAGKSVLINVLTALAGNSHVTIDLDELNNSPYQMADVAGKRIVTFTEPRANSVLADNHYKRLVSQDYISARQIFGKPFRFRPVCKVWGAMNELPRVVDRSDAIFNRVKIIPFNRIVPSAKRDPRLIDKLERELSGIFNLALIGLKRLRRAKTFSFCQQIEDAREQYKRENDIELAFVDDWCERDDSERVQASHLYDAYSTWCRKNGAFAKSSIKVSRDWQRLGFERIRSAGTWYAGIKLSETARSYVSS